MIQDSGKDYLSSTDWCDEILEIVIISQLRLGDQMIKLHQLAGNQIRLDKQN
jgi:hypothetical protein